MQSIPCSASVGLARARGHIYLQDKFMNPTHGQRKTVSKPLWMACVCAAACLVLAAPRAAQAEKSPAKGRAPIRDKKRIFQLQRKSWLDLRRQNVVMQQRDYSCGAAALATLIRFHLHDDVTEIQLLREIVKMLTAQEMKERVKNGLSMTDLRRLAVRLGYFSSSVRLDFDKLQKSKVPLIVGIVVNKYDHFVLYRGTDGKYVYLADPARGNVRTPIPEFKKQWQKNAALVVVKPGKVGKEKSPFMVTPQEASLGKLNRLYLRDRVTTKTFPH